MHCEWISTFNKHITFRIRGVLLTCLSLSSDISMTRFQCKVFPLFLRLYMYCSDTTIESVYTSN